MRTSPKNKENSALRPQTRFDVKNLRNKQNLTKNI